MVEGRLLVLPKLIIPVRADGSERFCANYMFAVDVCGGGGLLNVESAIGGRPVRGPSPELAHRDSAANVVPDSIDRRSMRSRSLWLNIHAILRCLLGKPRIMVHEYHVSNRLAEIGHESMRLLHASNYETCNDRQIALQVVSIIFFEIFTEILSPVHSAALPAVGFHATESATCIFRSRLHYWIHHHTPVEIESFWAEIIYHQPLPSVA